MTFGRRVPSSRYGTKLRWDGVTFFLSFSDGPYGRRQIILPSPIFLPLPCHQTTVSLCTGAECSACPHQALGFDFEVLLPLGFQFGFVLA